MKYVKCNLLILEGEEYVRVTYFNNKKQTEEIFYHRNCYKQFHKDKFQEEYDKKMKPLAPVLKSLFKKLQNSSQMEVEC